MGRHSSRHHCPILKTTKVLIRTVKLHQAFTNDWRALGFHQVDLERNSLHMFHHSRTSNRNKTCWSRIRSMLFRKSTSQTSLAKLARLQDRPYTIKMKINSLISCLRFKSNQTNQSTEISQQIQFHIQKIGKLSCLSRTSLRGISYIHRKSIIT